MELGSEFNICLEDLKVTQNSIYFKLKNYNTYFLDSGRNAIKLLLKKSIRVKYYCLSIFVTRL